MEGTPEEVYKYAYQECMDGARDGRFILSGDCDVSPMTPDENVIEAVRAAKDAEKVLFGKKLKRGEDTLGEIKDFNCTYDNSAGINWRSDGEAESDLSGRYLHHETMAELSKALKEHDGAAFCELPFCHTVEAEAMGGLVNYGNDKTGPRAKEYICTKPEELLELPAIDFTTGRIHEVLLACKELRKQGQHVVLQVSGPFTILNVLIDARYVFKGMRKQPEVMKKVFWKLGDEILRFMEEAKKYDVDLISYADSSGGVNILGPKMAEQVVEDFTFEFLKKAEAWQMIKR